MPSLPDRIGQLTLVRPIGRGGTGEIWQGRQDGVDVAVKLLRDGFPHRGLFDEATAIAAMDHPGIVPILDYGVHNGRPYLVMELAQGTLSDVEHRPGTWEEIRDALASVLDALAHAHARGMIHRDLKPSNVLRCATGLKLCDFGIAWRLREYTDSEVIGTLNFMSPEQLLGRWRDFGPWTDLYAVGVIGWLLCTAELPFEAAAPQNNRVTERLAAARRPFRPVVDVPVGVEDWLLALIGRDAAQRPAMAADAKHALDKLGPVVEGSARFAPSLRSSLHELPTSTDTGLGAAPVLPPPTEHTTMPAPEVPDGWGSAHSHREHHTGLGALRLRRPPMVGRHGLRDQLWQALRAVALERRPQILTLSGEAGVGKTRLAEWLAVRAEEVGAATVVRIRFHDRAAAVSSLAEVLRAELRAASTEPPLVEAWLERWLPELKPAVRGPLAAMATGALHPQPLVAAGLCAAWLATRSARRTVVLVVDDLDCAAGAGQLVAEVFDRLRQAAVPVLVVACGRIPELEIRGRVLGLGRLTDDDCARLAHRLCAPDAGVRTTLVAEAGGLPLYVVEVLRGWAATGALVSERGRARLHQGLPNQVPQSLHELHGRRIDEALLEVSEAETSLFLLAAVMGDPFLEDELAAAAGTLGLEVPAGFYDRFARLGLLVPQREHGQWAFSHRLLARSVRQRAVELGCAERLHLASLEVLGVPDGADALVRASVHHEALGDLESGLDARIAAMAMLRDREDFAALLSVAAMCERLVGRIVASDPRWALVWCHSAYARVVLAERLEPAECHGMLQRCDAHGWSEEIRCRLLLYCAIAAKYGPDETSYLERMLVLAEQAALTEQVSVATRALGHIQLREGDGSGAAGVLEHSVAAARQCGSGLRLMQALHTLGMAHVVADNDGEACAALAEAMQIAVRLGRPSDQVFLGIIQAAVAERAHDRDRELELLESAMALAPFVGRIAAYHAETSLATHWAQHGDAGKARPILERWAREDPVLVTGEFAAQRGISVLGVAVCEARLGRWEEAFTELDEAVRISAHCAPQMVLASLAESLGGAAEASGRLALAAQAYRLALWSHSCRDAAEVDVVRARLWQVDPDPCGPGRP
jgi:eukaryotic-like serine/threonine-protein kinase